ncbi:DUF2798 domain-containing protein [Roseibium sp. SCP14]|uniref:DUF2798 domain-containing protein n=1 Tax=Roseibium sp. SCP14 TaxID=3141375 RepID=UPI00333925D8
MSRQRERRMKHRLIATFLMSLGLSFFMSCWVTFINLGWSETFLQQWMAAFRLAWPAAAVIAFFLGPAVQRTATLISRRLP